MDSRGWIKCVWSDRCNTIFKMDVRLRSIGLAEERERERKMMLDLSSLGQIQTSIL